MSEYARRCTLDVSINGHPVADKTNPYLLSFTYTDNAHGKADEIQISLHDRDGFWRGAWKPAKGDPVEAALVCTDWEEPGQVLVLPCGSFKVDEIEFSGPPDLVNIKCISSTLTTQFRDSQKTRGWENSTFQAVAGQIAGENGLALMYSGDPLPFKRLDQRNMSDLSFVFSQADKFALNCKCHDGMLIIQDAESAEAAGAMLSIPRTGNMYSPKRYSYKDSSAATRYTDAKAAYTDPKTGKTHTGSAVANNLGKGSGAKTLTLQERVESAGEAIRLSKAKLHNANTKEQTASIECMGCPYMVAGKTIDLIDFGDFSGKYFIKTATHKLGGGSAYTTSLELTKGASASGTGGGDVV